MVRKYNASDLPSDSESRQSHVEFIRINLELLLALYSMARLQKRRKRSYHH
jgi:hypothetical protein